MDLNWRDQKSKVPKRRKNLRPEYMKDISWTVLIFDAIYKDMGIFSFGSIFYLPTCFASRVITQTDLFFKFPNLPSFKPFYKIPKIVSIKNTTGS